MCQVTELINNLVFFGVFVLRWASVAGQVVENPPSLWPSSAWWTCLKVELNVDTLISQIKTFF